MKNHSLESDPSDGFTKVEMSAISGPTLRRWQPRVNYEDVGIGELAPGPQYVALIGRIVNVNDQNSTCKAPQAAKGCWRITVKDETGALLASESSWLEQFVLAAYNSSS